MNSFRWNDWITIKKARRAKRIRQREIARRKREIGARALIGAAKRHPDGIEYLYELGYGKRARGAREGWPLWIG